MGLCGAAASLTTAAATAAPNGRRTRPFPGCAPAPRRRRPRRRPLLNPSPSELALPGSGRVSLSPPTTTSNSRASAYQVNTFWLVDPAATRAVGRLEHLGCASDVHLDVGVLVVV